MVTTQTTTANSRTGFSDLNFKKISWAAVFGGAMIALGIQILLSLLGLGIGMSSVDPLKEQNPVEGLGTGALIWWIATFLMALLGGGWVAGRLSRTAHKFESILHGILTWVVFVLFNIYLLTSAAGRILNTTGSVLSNTLSLVGQGANVPGVSQKMDLQNVKSSDVQNEVDKLQAKANDPATEAKARRVGEDVAKGMSQAGFYSFFGLLLGAVVAGLGAYRGRRSDDDLALLDEDPKTERIKRYHPNEHDHIVIQPQ